MLHSEPHGARAVAKPIHTLALRQPVRGGVSLDAQAFSGRVEAVHTTGCQHPDAPLLVFRNTGDPDARKTLGGRIPDHRGPGLVWVVDAEKARPVRPHPKPSSAVQMNAGDQPAQAGTETRDGAPASLANSSQPAMKGANPYVASPVLRKCRGRIPQLWDHMQLVGGAVPASEAFTLLDGADPDISTGVLKYPEDIIARQSVPGG